MYRFVHVAPKSNRDHTESRRRPRRRNSMRNFNQQNRSPLRFTVPPSGMTLRRDSSVGRRHALIRRFVSDGPNEYRDYDDFSSTAVRQILPMAEKGG